MVFSYTTAGMAGQENIVRGNVSMVSGTFTGGSQTTPGTIDTGGSKILTAWVSNGAAADRAPKLVLNKNAAAATANGIMTITLSATGSADTGDWGAVVTN